MVIESLGLPLFEDIESLAEETRLTGKLLYFLTKDDAAGRYKSFSIPKKDGSFREINAPCLSLKILQRWVLENILYKTKVSRYSIGFVRGTKGSPLVRCAERHRNHLYILKMDLKNFFPSISRAKVFKQFILLGYNSYAANLLTNVCTLNGSLPQGAVTSPYLANLVCNHLDARIAGYCNKRDITYTRYADDMAFSCDNRDLLHKIYGMIKKIVEDEGFSINEKKTQFLTPKVHKEILGVTTNDGLIKASKELKHLIRAAIHYQIVTGDYSDNDKLRGYIAFVDSIEKNYKSKIINYVTKLIGGELTLFPEVVDSFNNNKLYKSLPDMKNSDYGYFILGAAYNDDEYELACAEREKYLATH